MQSKFTILKFTYFDLLLALVGVVKGSGLICKAYNGDCVEDKITSWNRLEDSLRERRVMSTRDKHRRREYRPTSLALSTKGKCDGTWGGSYTDALYSYNAATFW